MQADRGCVIQSGQFLPFLPAPPPTTPHPTHTYPFYFLHWTWGAPSQVTGRGRPHTTSFSLSLSLRSYLILHNPFCFLGSTLLCTVGQASVVNNHPYRSSHFASQMCVSSILPREATSNKCVMKTLHTFYIHDTLSSPKTFSL